IASNGTACNDGNAGTCSDVCTAGVCGGTTCTSPAYGGMPRSITTTIQAEDYDTGGEGAGYHDADPANQGAAYRMDGVDVQACGDAGGGFDVGWTLAGEWLDYSVVAATAGSYSVSLRVASTTAGQTMHLEMDGANVTGPITVPNTAGWQTFQTINLGLESYLTAGNHVLRVVFDAISATSGGINLNWFTFTATPGPYGGSIRSLTSTIQAEDYDLGGEGIGYHDQEAANQGGAYRLTEGVDVQATTDAGGGFNVGYVAAGEWLTYTTSSATTRAYTVNLRVATLTAQSLHVEVDGVNVSGAIALPATGAWQTFQTVSKAFAANVTAGNHLVRVVFDSGGVNLNWLSFN
ncbi:MAG TPA: carbohydrate-binding domain-containing protein, partial [Polyangiaceae bacterium]